MYRTLVSRLALLIGLVTLAAPLAGQGAKTTVAVIGVVLDGPSAAADSARAVVEREVAAFFAGGTAAAFPARYRMTGNYTLAGATTAIDRLMAEKEVDIVITLGPIASHELARRKILAKPAIAALVIDGTVQGLPVVEGTSGIHNLSYIDVAFPASRALEAFRQVVPYRRLALLVNAGVPAAIPELPAHVGDLVRARGATVTIVPVTASAADAMRQLPADVDAVSFGPLDQFTGAQRDSLIQGFNARRLPTFSLSGRYDVERGVLASYASEDDLVRRARRIASSIARINDGADPSTFPVILSSVGQLTLNMETARTIHFSPSWDVLTEAILLNDEAPSNGPLWNLSSVGHTALSSNLDLKVADGSVRTAGQDTRLRRAALLPQVQAEATGMMIREETAAKSFGTQAEREAQARLLFSQKIIDDAAWSDHAVAKFGEQGRLTDRRRNQLEVVLRATTAYLNVLRTKAIARVERENLARTRSNLEMAQLKEQVGAAGLADVYRWQAELAQSRRRVLDANARVQVASLELNGVLNRPLEEGFRTEEASVTDPALLISEPRMLAYLANPAVFAVYRDFAVAEGLKASPEIQGIELQIAAEERKESSARRSFWMPTLALEGGLSSTFARGGAGAATPTIDDLPVERAPDETWSIQLKAALPIFTGFARKAKKDRASSEVERLTVSRQSAALTVAQQIRASLQLAAASWANIEQARLAADAAGKNLGLVTDAYSRGTVNLVTLLDAQQSALESNEAAANAVYDFLTDLMKAQRAIGGFDFLYTPDERDAFYQRLEEHFRTAGAVPVQQ